MILNYILALSLVLLSVVKTADLFIQSDKALGKLQDQFIQSTRDLIKSPKGNISLTAAILCGLLSALLLFYVTKMKVEYAEALYRKESYLCARYLNTQTQNYISEMAAFNISLRAAFATRSTMIGGVSGELIWKGLTLARNTRHGIYMKQMASNRFCHLPETGSYLAHPPFKINTLLQLVTLMDETSIMREKTWTYNFYKIPSGIRLKKSFCLKSTFSQKSAFLPKARFKSEEMPALSSLKCLSGPSSSPSS